MFNDRITLKKLLILLGQNQGKITSILREDIRNELSGYLATGGGDFHMPFWSDIKSYLAGTSNIQDATSLRVASNERRARLYPLLRDGFLAWESNNSRLTAEAINVDFHPLRGTLEIDEFGLTITVNNLLNFTFEDGSERHIYPYFSEVPPLEDDAARLGLWVIQQALPAINNNDIRILDLLRSRAFSIGELGFSGNEQETLLNSLRELENQRETLMEQY